MTRSVQSALLTLVSMAVGLAFAAPASAITFDAPATYAFSDGSAGDRALATGDLTGDGRPDIVGSRKTSPQLTLLVNDGDGTFTSMMRPSPTAAQDLAIADVNRDGRNDVVVAGNAGLSFQLGDGAGGLTAGTFVATAETITGIAVGDVDHDGLPDVVGGLSGGEVVLFPGSAPGTPQTLASGLTGGRAEVQLTDLNRDSDLDVVVTTADASAVALLGDGSGGFAAPSVLPAPANALGATLADVDRDAKADLLAPGPGSALSIARGAGDGSFTAQPPDALPAAASALAAGDLDRDGRTDLVAAGDSGVAVLGGESGTSFADGATALANASADVALADFDGDGRTDMAVAGAGHELWILRNATPFATPNVFASPDPAPATTNGPSTVVTGDLNRDGIPDLVVTQETGARVGVMFGNGDGTYGARADYWPGGTPTDVVIADVNRDGAPDLLTANTLGDTLGVLLNAGDGTFLTATTYSAGFITSPSGVVVDDFNRDGKLDAATANREGQNVAVYLGNGDGTFQASVRTSVRGRVESLVSGDFNGDGRADIVSPGYSGDRLNIMLGNGDGTFAALNYDTRLPIGGGAYGSEVGDFNRDGRLDLAVASYWNSVIAVLLGNGDGTFQYRVEYPVSGTPRALAVGDATNDGLPDLVTTNASGETLSILRGNGDGTFAAERTTPIPPSSYGVTTGDLNRDGLTDVVASAYTTQVMAVLLAGTDAVAPVTTDNVSSGWYVTARATVRLTAADTGGGSIAATYYTTGVSPAVPDTSSTLYNASSPPQLNDGEKISYFSVDTAGNAEVVKTSAAVRIDSVRPTTADDVPSGWQRAPVTVTLTASDALSGVVSTHYTIGASPSNPNRSSARYDPASKPTLTNGQRIRYFSYDAAGNSETSKTSIAARVDAAAPTTADDVPAGWQRDPVTVTLSADDGVGSGSGVAATYYTTGIAPGVPDTSSAVYDAGAKPVLSDGEKIAYFSVDAAGNAELVKTSAAARVDATTPTTTLGAVPDAFTSVVRPAVAFSTTADGATFECSLDGDPFLACSSPFVPSADLADGPHEVRVRAVGRTGSVESVPAAAQFVVDTVAPAAPALVSGPPASGEATAATIEFSGEADATFVCAVDAGAGATCESPVALRDLAVGDHVVDISQRDRAGNDGAALTVRFAVVAPEERRDDTPRGGDDQPRGGDEPRGGDQPDGNEPPRSADLPPGSGASPPPPPPAEPTAILPRVGGGDGARADVVFAGVTTVLCQPNAGTIVACELTARSVREIRAADRRTLPAGTVLAQGVAQQTAAGLATKRLTLTSAGRSALLNHPLGRAARLVLSARTASGRVVVSETTIRLRFLAGQSLTIRYPGRGAELPEHVRDALQRLVRAVSPVTSVLCIADTDPSGDACADLALTRVQAKRACDYLGARGLKGKRSSAGRGSTRPRASNRTTAGRALNRRLTLRIAP